MKYTSTYDIVPRYQLDLLASTVSGVHPLTRNQMQDTNQAQLALEIRGSCSR